MSNPEPLNPAPAPAPSPAPAPAPAPNPAPAPAPGPAPVADDKGGNPAPKAEAPAPSPAPLKLPEGSTLAPESLEKIAAFAKEQGLSQEAAQALVNRESNLAADFAKAQEKQLEEANKRWVDESLKDPEIGGEALAKNLEMSKRVYARFGTPALVEMLNKSGLANHPEVVRFGKTLGAMMSEDTLIIPSAQAGEAKSDLDAFWPKPKE